MAGTEAASRGSMGCTRMPLKYAVVIHAPRESVWDTMLGPEGFREWTAAVCEGSHYEGSWAQKQTSNGGSTTPRSRISNS